MSNRIRLLGLTLLLPLAVSCVNPQPADQPRSTAAAPAPAKGPAAVTQARLTRGTDDTALWGTYGGSYNEQRFSPLTKINDTNIKELGLAFYSDYDSNQNQHGSPLYADGVIYVSASRNHLYAIDARDGKRLWTYAPAQVPHQNLGNANKGIAMWNGKIYMGTLDGRLVAIDARNGKPVWETDTIPAKYVRAADRTKYSVSMPPRVAKGKVFVGASGGEFGSRGFIAAYDAETGKEAWRFWTVPGDPAKGYEAEPQQKAVLAVAAATWGGSAYWEYTGGGGAVWDAVVYDPVLDLLYVGTGQPSPWNSAVRDPKLGDALFTNSIIAVKPDTGEYVWHYQATPADQWDFDNVSPMMTADLTFNGVKKRVIIQPSKNGMLYVLEAANGKLISGDPFTVVNWNTGIDMKTGRPIEVEAARYLKEPWNVAPGPPGGHTWHPNAFSPITGLIYIPTWENYGVVMPQTVPAGGTPPLISFSNTRPPGLKPNSNSQDVGWLQAWDPVARKVVWETPKSARATSGAMATAGNLVFMGNSNGRQLSAYNAKTGEKLWTYDVQTAIYAAPITYELDGVQYIAASVGGTAQGDYFAPSYARMVVFKVGGTAKLPPNAPYTPRPLNPPPLTASAEAVTAGSALYATHCAACHGANAGAAGGRGGGNAPDLGTSPFISNQVVFDTVVLQGQRVDKGMANFSDKLKPADSAAVRAYVVSRANERKSAPAAPPGGGRGGGPGFGAGGPGAGAAGAPAGARPAGAAATVPAPAPAAAAPRDVHEDAATAR